tara:strand:- start:336 stop:986 length:651 start_codon:yes stop_codon:yes gene_type:complete
MKLKVTALAAILLLGAVAYLGYGKYQDFRFIESSTPFVKNSSLRLMNELNILTASNSGITYKEMFERLELDISEIDKNILQIQTIATPKHNALSEPILAYLNGAQVLQRAMLSKFRKYFVLSSALDQTIEAGEELKDSNEYTRDIYLKQFNRGQEEVTKAMSEHEQASVSLLDAAKRMKELTIQVKKVVSGDSVIEISKLDAVISKVKLDETSKSE